MARTAESAWAVAALLLALAVQSQAQAADGSLWKSVETCQKIVKKHVALAESTVDSTLDQLAEAKDTMEIYVKRWGSLVSSTRPESSAQVSKCLSTFLNNTAEVRRKLEGKLRDSLDSQVQWYDAEVFGLLTDALTEEGQAGVVQNVKFHLEPALKQFGSMAVSALKQSMKDLKTPYISTAKCIRDLELKYSAVI